MRGRLAAGKLAALVLGILISGIGIANTARAFEWDLPGERKFSIHGFYEARLLFTGEDLPANHVTFSQFRHVLSLELELSLFPDGFGPFDSMFMFTRVLASYDCIYTRACALFSSADSYGDTQRRAIRQPASLKENVKNKSPYFGGLLRQVYQPGTLTDAREEFNPGRRYRQCDNPPGIFQNPFPLSAFCNLNQRSPLDGPLKPGLPQVIAVRGGNFSRLSRESLLNSARPTVGDAEFFRLRNLLIGGNTLSITQEGLRRALLVDAAVAQRAGDTAAAKAAQAEADAILGTPETTFDANVDEVLDTRPDPNRFAIFARSLAPGLLTAKWGSNKIGTAITPFLATIDTPINPKGYFAGSQAVDWFGTYETGLADDLTGIAQVAGSPNSTDADGLVVVDPQVTVKKSNPFFMGPDGIRDTADDLPFVANNNVAQEAGYRLAAPIAGTAEDKFDSPPGGLQLYTATAQLDVQVSGGGTKTLELYGIYNRSLVLQQGCGAGLPARRLPGLGGTYNPATQSCTKNGADISQDAFLRGCRIQSDASGTSKFNIGINGDGDCIEVNNASVGTARVQFEVFNLLADPRLRPSSASSEPFNATDLLLYGNTDGIQIPARPRLKGNGIVYQSPGSSNFYKDHKGVVTRLDLHFKEDELQWNHGASQKEHEFAEGYVEFEMADSQIFTKVGKLIQVWGKTELFRNQDRNNPLDIGNGLFAPLEESRVGQWAIDVTFSPEMFMRVGPVEDLRLELLWIFNRFEPTDLGKCGEGGAVDLICLKSFGAMANGLAAIGVAGERRPDKDYNGLQTWDYGARIEGRLDRFTFAISDFWGWDDGFYLDLVQQYERTADFTSGAPLSTTQRAGGKCQIRTAAAPTEEDPNRRVAVGPNGIAGDADDVFPTDGDCLLWDKPGEDGRQKLRAPEAIAALHNVNQTLFHSVCAFTFDQDEGYCAFDRLNNPNTFGFISNILGGLGRFGSIVLDGVDTIRPVGSPDPFSVIDSNTLSVQWLAVNKRQPINEFGNDLGLNLVPEQAALLGCGAAYASPCSRFQGQQWEETPAIANSLKRNPTDPPPRFGGIDLMNADGSVITQDFTGLKAVSPGALVGTRVNADGQLEYLPGINYSYDGTTEFMVDLKNTANFANFPRGKFDPITPDEVIAMGRVGRAKYQMPSEENPNGRQTDGWIEPMPWQIDQDAKQKFGAVVFLNDPTNPFDPESDLNVWNLIDKKQGASINSLFDNVDGEYCARWMNNQSETDVNTPFNGGCTALETASANFERLLIATEIIGFDRIFDPPESLAELSAWGSNNTAKQLTGDPIAGPDGIFARNAFVFSNEEMDFQVFPVRTQGASQVIAPPTSDKNGAYAWLIAFDPETECPAAECLADVTDVLSDPTDLKVTGFRMAIDLPIAFTVEVVDEPNDPSLPVNVLGARKLNLAALNATNLPALRRLMSGNVVQIGDEFFRMNAAQRIGTSGLFGPSQVSAAAPVRDRNGDKFNDFDQDRDGIWDGLDDYSPGPVTDDNILCGSGLRGDPLQEGIQYEPYKIEDAPGSAKFKAKFPNGLPPRSPVFCRGVAGIVGGTTQTLPVKKAGGDGRYGRRDFLWQGGRQVAARYQKRNVFGFGLDFAEDVTKTSWGIEFSWMARKLFGNTQEFSGLSQSDQLVLSVSVDRPTFFNFLNPNRSFFLNYQMFVSYLPNYQGGKRNKDGMYGTQAGPFSTQMVLTFFTGYFQDRLAPRMSVVYWPLESQGAVLSGLSYRWNDAFSTSIGYSSFFGHVYDAQGAYFPIAQYGSIEQYNGAILGRGAAPVLNRDQMEVRFRYTW